METINTIGVGRRKGSAQRKYVSKFAKAGIEFPVGRIARYLKKGRYAQIISFEAPIYLAVVLQYLVAEVLVLAGNVAMDNNKNMINPRHLLLVVKNDEELEKLLHGVTIASGRILPSINHILLLKKSQSPKKD